MTDCMNGDQGCPPLGRETLARSGWLLRLGRGAYGLPGDTLRRDDGLAWRGVRHNLAGRETVVLWGDQPARLPAWLEGVGRVRYRVAPIFAPELPAGLDLVATP